MKRIFASTKFLTKSQMRNLIKENCPIRLFRHINIVNDGKLMLQYRIPSKIRGIDLSLTTDLDKSAIDYLINNEMDVSNIGGERWMINNVRSLQNQANSAIKEYCRMLNSEQSVRYNRRIRELQDCINNQCTCNQTRRCTQLWKDLRELALSQLNEEV